MFCFVFYIAFAFWWSPQAVHRQVAGRSLRGATAPDGRGRGRWRNRVVPGTRYANRAPRPHPEPGGHASPAEWPPLRPAR